MDHWERETHNVHQNRMRIPKDKESHCYANLTEKTIAERSSHQFSLASFGVHPYWRPFKKDSGSS
jgi:hypothetical protein